MEWVLGLEPRSSAWKAESLPLTYTRLMVERGGIEPPFPACKAGVIPLYYRPINHRSPFVLTLYQYLTVLDTVG